MRAAKFILLLLVVLSLNGRAGADATQLFVLEGTVGINSETGEDNNVIDLVESFVDNNAGTGFPLMAGVSGYQGSLDYLGVEGAVLMDVNINLLTDSTIDLFFPSTGVLVSLTSATPDGLGDSLDDWLKNAGTQQWASFLRAMNAAAPLALISGNPRSTVAVMGQSAYRKFGFDDSFSRDGFSETITKWGGFELRLDVGANSVHTESFNDGLWTVEPALTLAGEFGRHVGLSFSIIGQYRDYKGATLIDVGAEIALPITLKRPDEGPYFWQVTPFFQGAGGVSLDLAAGGIFIGGGLVNALGWNRGDLELLMSNEIAYYGGLPVPEIGGYTFTTGLAQLFFKNGLTATWVLGKSFYATGGVHFSNFAVDGAAVPWFATPIVGVGWRAGRLFNVSLAYEVDLSGSQYRSHRPQLKLDFFF